MPRRHNKAIQSGSEAIVKPQGAKKHVQTTRGRVLAAGDVDPAAGSRDEPTRLHVEGHQQGIEVQVHKSVVLVIN